MGFGVETDNHDTVLRAINQQLAQNEGSREANANLCVVSLDHRRNLVRHFMLVRD